MPKSKIYLIIKKFQYYLKILNNNFITKLKFVKYNSLEVQKLSMKPRLIGKLEDLQELLQMHQIKINNLKTALMS